MKTKRKPSIAQQTFFDNINKMFLKQPHIGQKKMFGTTALTVKSKVFAFSWKGNLVVKLSSDRVAEIVKSKKGIYFDPGHGRTSKEWVAVLPKLQKQWHTLASEARDFVLSQIR